LDKYTESTKNWLDRDYRRHDDEGIYVAHQPIYGFRKGHSMPSVTERYCVTYQIMRALQHLKFDSLLDAGGLEGYKAALARSLFNVNIRNCDLSIHACKRAKEIYNIDSEQVDIHHLPYKDDEFDVVLCSETLEHVADMELATKELIRVCKKAVVITVPHESKEIIEKNIKDNIDHGHIYSLDTRSFDFALPFVSRIISWKMLCPVLKIPRLIMDASKVYVAEKDLNYPKRLLDLFNFFVPAFSAVFGKRSVGMLIHLDYILSNCTSYYSGILFILLKDDSIYSKDSQKSFSTSQLLEFKVPYHYLDKKL
jgi:SAM-dependent methyltransferase